MNWFKLLAALLQLAAQVLGQQAKAVDSHPQGILAGPKDDSSAARDIIRQLRQVADDVERDLQREAIPPFVDTESKAGDKAVKRFDFMGKPIG